MPNELDDVINGSPENMKIGYHGIKLGTGEQVLTRSGHPTTPYPKVDCSTNRKTINTVKRVHEWLLTNALIEAVRNDDDFATRQFRGDIICSKGKYPPASIEAASYYLFDI